jgi:hypothetical protein
MSRKANLLLRLRAALWCAAVAAIPTVAFLWLISGGLSFRAPSLPPSTFFVIPVAAAALSGFWIGWRLLDPTAHHNAVRALLLGAAVWLLAYVLMGGLLLLTVAPQNYVQMVQSGAGARLVATLPGDLLGVLELVGIAIGITGWFTLPIACLAAYLLSRRYRAGR